MQSLYPHEGVRAFSALWGRTRVFIDTVCERAAWGAATREGAAATASSTPTRPHAHTPTRAKPPCDDSDHLGAATAQRDTRFAWLTLRDMVEAVGTTAATTAEQIAWGAAQTAAIRADARFAGGDYYDAADGEGPHVGLGIARMIAHTTYRSESELHARFGRTVQADDDGNPGDILRGPGEPGSGQYAIESYLAHHAEKLARRFDANTYLRIVHAINTHDVGRSRGGIAAALNELVEELLDKVAALRS